MTLTRRQLDTLMRQRQITRREAVRELAASRQRDAERRRREADPGFKEMVQEIENAKREWEALRDFNS